MKYKIIRDNYLRIDDQVNDHLSTGWELHGYPYAVGSIIMQAVVKTNIEEVGKLGSEGVEELRSEEGESGQRRAECVETESGERRVESVGKNKNAGNAQV